MRLSATLAELHTVRKALEEAEARAVEEKRLFEEQTTSFEHRIDLLTQRLDGLLKNYQVSAAYHWQPGEPWARLEALSRLLTTSLGSRSKRKPF